MNTNPDAWMPFIFDCANAESEKRPRLLSRELPKRKTEAEAPADAPSIPAEDLRANGVAVPFSLNVQFGSADTSLSVLTHE